MRSFITGSRAYGQPKDGYGPDDSDVDLVIHISGPNLEVLLKMADEVLECGERFDEYSGPASASLRFGKLNLIAVTDEAAYAVWAAGTSALQHKAPVTRDQAIDFFRKLRAKCLKSAEDVTAAEAILPVYQP